MVFPHQRLVVLQHDLIPAAPATSSTHDDATREGAVGTYERSRTSSAHTGTDAISGFAASIGPHGDPSHETADAPVAARVHDRAWHETRNQRRVHPLLQRSASCPPAAESIV